MSSLDDHKLPPLPNEARFAVSAFRTEEPSPYQRARIHAALQVAERRKRRHSGRADKPLARASNLHHGLWVMMATALTSVLLLVGMERSQATETEEAIREALPLREVAVQVPKDGGWVVLPWNLDRHPEGLARVHLEAPTELDFHQHSSHLPAVQLVSCEEDRCLHQFMANAGDSAEPLRVRIHRPGRYVLNVSHASKERHINESFIVRAEP